MRAQQKAPHLAIVGIGVNANQSDFPNELQDKATSLAMTLGRRVNRREFAVALLRHLDRTYRKRFVTAPR
jgi:BirA family biotin operon repressor/biotin-[acetyl-CoA-carboxylase] ligase